MVAETAPMSPENKPQSPASAQTPAPTEPTDDQSGEKIRKKPEEIGGPKGLEPTRYGDWERKGRCIDF